MSNLSTFTGNGTLVHCWGAEGKRGEEEGGRREVEGKRGKEGRREGGRREGRRRGERREGRRRGGEEGRA